MDAKPNALGLPTNAYYAVEEVHDVRSVYCIVSSLTCLNIIIPLDLQGAYPRYEIHTSVFAVHNENQMTHEGEASNSYRIMQFF